MHSQRRTGRQPACNQSSPRRRAVGAGAVPAAGPIPAGSLVAGQCPDCAGLQPLPLRGEGGRFLPGLTPGSPSLAGSVREAPSNAKRAGCPMNVGRSGATAPTASGRATSGDRRQSRSRWPGDCAPGPTVAAGRVDPGLACKADLFERIATATADTWPRRRWPNGSWPPPPATLSPSLSRPPRPHRDGGCGGEDQRTACGRPGRYRADHPAAVGDAAVARRHLAMSAALYRRRRAPGRRCRPLLAGHASRPRCCCRPTPVTAKSGVARLLVAGFVGGRGVARRAGPHPTPGTSRAAGTGRVALAHRVPAAAGRPPWKAAAWRACPGTGCCSCPGSPRCTPPEWWTCWTCGCCTGRPPSKSIAAPRGCGTSSGPTAARSTRPPRAGPGHLLRPRPPHRHAAADPAAPPSPVNLAALPVALSEDGTVFRLRLLGGTSWSRRLRSREGVGALVDPHGVAALIRAGAVELHGIDPKRMELVFAPELFTQTNGRHPRLRPPGTSRSWSPG